LFEEEGDGGGPNYTVFLRDTDGSPPAHIGEGLAGAISPDGKWVITRAAKGGPLTLVPTGAGESRPITHDAVSYEGVRFLPDGKHVLAVGIEAGHGGRDYLIDLSSGDSKPITPEGIAGTRVSPDGKNVALRGPDEKWGVWPLDGGGFRPIPGLEAKYYAIGWTQDGASIYVAPNRGRTTVQEVSRVNIQTGKIEPWKTFGGGTSTGISTIGTPRLSADGNAYAYLYVRVLSEAYVVKGLK
jgi:WD40 repeat protein